MEYHAQRLRLLVYPNLSSSDLLIRFSQPIASVALTFVTFDWQDVITPTPLLVEASVDTTNTPAASGTAMGTITVNETPQVSGRIQVSSATPFNLVCVTLPPAGPLAATDFVVDNVTVTTIPPLKVQLTGNTPVISWPVTEDYVLQTIGDLGAGGWTDITTGITIVGGNKQFAASSTTGQTFFRLQHR